MVITGLEKLLHDSAMMESLRGKRAALLVNHTSVTRDYVYSWDALRGRGCAPVRIFSPEHGLFGTEQDQVACDPMKLHDIDVVSLYGTSPESLKPEDRVLDGLDVIIYDIQDIGTRYYTFVNTMILFMKALAGSDIEFMVLDRPNPLGGTLVEGPLVEEGYESFVGVEPVPVRHGLTAGEMARLVRARYGLDLHLTVVPMENWNRDMYYDDTGLPWLAPSPNMPATATALVYPGQCLLEGMNISEGRGTTTPFELFGAPWIDPYVLSRRLAEYDLSGAAFRPHFFRPTFNKYAGQVCGGLHMHVTDRRAFRPFLAGVAVVKAVHDLYPRCEFLTGVYEFNDRHPSFDLLAGSDRVRRGILEGKSLTDISKEWIEAERSFLEEKKEYHLYRD